jgi:hypothetical protein
MARLLYASPGLSDIDVPSLSSKLGSDEWYERYAVPLSGFGNGGENYVLLAYTPDLFAEQGPLVLCISQSKAAADTIRASQHAAQELYRGSGQQGDTPATASMHVLQSPVSAVTLTQTPHHLFVQL